ncbi:MAG: AAA family ATPase [Anaerolineales bacterium]
MEPWPDPADLWGADWKEQADEAIAARRGLSPSRPSHSLRTLHGPDLILSPAPEPKYCVQGLFACPSLNVLVGDPGHKKSFLAIDLGISVAMGKPWLGCTVSQKPVVLVEEESGLLRLWKRLNSAFAAHAATDQTPFHFISAGAYDFRDIAEAQDLIEHARSVGAGLIIIDSLADVMVGGNENSVLSIQPILRHLRAVTIDCGAAVVLVHHTNKSGLFRGSTSISAGVDHMLSVYSPPGQNLIRLTTLKSRDVEPITLHAQVHFEPDRFWLTSTDQRFAEDLPAGGLSPSARRILVFLAEHPRASTPALMQHLNGSSPSAVRKLLYDLMVTGLINRSDGKAQGKLARYELSPHGRNLLSTDANVWNNILP